MHTYVLCCVCVLYLNACVFALINCVFVLCVYGAPKCGDSYVAAVLAVHQLALLSLGLHTSLRWHLAVLIC